MCGQSTPGSGADTGREDRGRAGPHRGLRADTRGVQWTLEAVLAVLLLLSALAAVAAVLPTGTGQAEAELAGTQLQQAGDDVLGLAAAEGNLTATLLYWNTTAETFVDAETDLGGSPHHVQFDGDETHPLAGLLAGTVGERALAYNIHVEYEVGGGATEQRPLVYQGPPGGDSVTASTTVVLSEGDRPHASPGNCTLAELDDPTACEGETFYAPNADATDRYNTVQVVVELWRV